MIKLKKINFFNIYLIFRVLTIIKSNFFQLFQFLYYIIREALTFSN